MKRPRLRAILVRGVVVGVALLVGLTVAEGVLRILGAAPTEGVSSVTEIEFEEVPGVLSPGQRLIDRRNPSLPHAVTVNRLGYRGNEVAVHKEAGELRVLFVGDSFVYGDFVNDDETLPAQLERRLEARCGQARVINAGLGDATIVDEVQLIARGLRLSPDLVILLFSENDIVDLNRPSTWDRLAANRRAKSHFPVSTLYALRHTALWNFALAVRARWRAEAQAARTRGPSPLTAAARADSLTRLLRETYHLALRSVRDTLAKRGIPLILVAYPSHLAVTDVSNRDQLRWISETAAEANVFEVNLLATLVDSGLPAETLYLLPRDGHPSPRGYTIAAEYLADRLLSDGPLAAACQAPPVVASKDRIDERREGRPLRED